MAIDIDELHFLIKSRYEYETILKKIRIEGHFKEEELLTEEEEEITW